MKLAVAIGAVFALGILTWRVCLLADAGTALLVSTKTAVDALPAEVDAIRLDLDAQIAATRSVTSAQIDRLRVPLLRLADARTGQALSLVDARLGQALTVVDSRTAAVGASLDGLRSDLRPVLQNAALLTKDAQDTLDALYPDIQAAVESGTVAATQTAQTAESVRQAVPKMLATAQKIEDNSDQTTAYSAQLFNNLTTITKPVLPWWARVGLAVAPPAAQTGFTIASWYALKGKQ